MCDLHSKTIILFCLDCDKSTCAVCLFKNQPHFAHEVVLIEDKNSYDKFIRDIDSKNKKLEKIQSENLEKIDNASKQNENLISQTETDYTSFLDSINKMQTKIETMKKE